MSHEPLNQPGSMDEEPPEGSGLFGNRSFVYLWLAQVLSQTALNAIVYTLLIQVEETTNSTTALSLLLLSLIVPSVIFGVAAGVFVDRWQKKQVLLITNLLRALIVATLLVFSDNFLIVLVVNFLFSIVSQFFAPAEIAVIPALVRREKLIIANGLFNFTMSAAQLMGFVIVGPLLVKSLGGQMVFVLFAMVYLFCACLIWMVRLDEPAKHVLPDQPGATWLGTMLDETRAGWQLLTGDAAISISIVRLTLVNSIILVVGMLAPGYVNRILGIRADDSVFVLAPAGFGMLAGIGLLSHLVLRWTKETIANVGVFATAGMLFALGFAGRAGTFLVPDAMLRRLGLAPISEEKGLIAIVMGLAFILGISYSLVNVAAQTMVQERVPFELRGRIFATQLAFANAAAVFPLLFLGTLADVVGITVVTFICGAVVLVVGLITSFQAHRARSLGWRPD